MSRGTLNTFLNGVKLQFLEYPYRILKPSLAWKNIQLSSVIDIACTKLQTIGMRGSKKDFVDVYFLLKKYSLTDLLSAMEQKYPEVNYNQPHIMKSLVYFDDADSQPMPRMHMPVEWEEIKIKMSDAVKGTAF